MNNKSKLESISYSEYTRGTKRVFTFTPTGKTVSVNDEITELPISADEWNHLVKQAELLNFSKISSLKSPTTDRYTDAAYTSVITINADHQVFNSASFDAGFPPKELEGLYNVLKSQSRSGAKSPKK